MEAGSNSHMVTVEDSRDFDALKAIFTHPDVWWRIGGDDKPEDFEPPRDCTYLLAKANGLPAGVFVLHEIKDGTDSHIQILPEFRKFKAEIGEACLRKASEYVSYITTDIPKEHPNVHQYALKNGYEVIGEDDQNWYYRKQLRENTGRVKL